MYPASFYNVALLNAALLIMLSPPPVDTVTNSISCNCGQRKNIRTIISQCTSCPTCFACIQEHKGWNIAKMCLASELLTVLTCLSQLRYYIQAIALPTDHCYVECTDCISDITQLGVTVPGQNDVIWENLFPGIMHNISYTFVSTCPGPGGTPPCCDGTLTNDNNQCCDTWRCRVPYLDNTTINSVTWYPVRYKTPTDNFYQFYDVVTCSPVSLACPGKECYLIQRPQVFLMTTDPPGADGFHSAVFLLYPYTNVRFFEIEVDSYCSCRNL